MPEVANRSELYRRRMAAREEEGPALSDYSSRIQLDLQNLRKKAGTHLGKYQNKSTVVLLISVVLSLLLGSTCKDRKYVYDHYKELRTAHNLVIVKLHATVVNNFDIYFPSTSSIMNGYFALVDSKADRMIRIIDLRTNTLLVSFGERGQGPDEFLGVRQIISDPNDKDYFWVYDISSRNLKQYNIDKVLNNEFYPNKIVRISTEKGGVPAQLSITQDKIILGVGLLSKGRISFYDMSGDFLRSIGNIPLVMKNYELAAQHSQGFIGNFVYKDASKEIYIATRLGTIVEKYGMDGNLVSTLIGPDSFFPEYDIVPAGKSYTMAYNRKTRYGYLDICYNKKLDRLFLLYSGKYQFSRDPKKQGYMGNIVYVLDNKDDIVEQIELDKNIFHINVTDDGSTLYGLSEKEILRYELIDSTGTGIDFRRRLF